MKALLTDSDRFGGDSLAVSRVSGAPEGVASAGGNVGLAEVLGDAMLAIDRGRLDQVRVVLRAVLTAVGVGDIYADAQEAPCGRGSGAEDLRRAAGAPRR